LAAALGNCSDTAIRDIHRAVAVGERLLDTAARRRVRTIAEALAQHDHLYVLGRGLSFPLALEAALKVKEGSYIHAEGFAAGELKHGVIALIEPGTPCVVLAPSDATRSAILSGAAEVGARGGLIVGLAGDNEAGFDHWLEVEDVGLATPLIQAMACQLLAYELALLRGVDPDRPRNLAKSVTVR